MRRMNLVWVAMVLVLAGGCQLDATFEAWARQGADSLEVSQTESALVVPAVEDLDAEMDGSAAAETAASRAPHFYRPTECVRATAVGGTVTYELDNCSGPHGLLHVTGSVVVDYERTAEGLRYTAISEGLDVNGSTVTMNNSGLFSRDGDTRTLVTEVNSEAVGPRGHAHTRTGTRVASWNPLTQCLTLDGTWTTSTEDRTWSTDVVGYERCAETCPSAGGEIRFTTPRNTLTLSFDGSDSATWETAKGRRGTVDISCGM